MDAQRGVESPKTASNRHHSAAPAPKRQPQTEQINPSHARSFASNVITRDVRNHVGYWPILLKKSQV
jgi:hypothetical protein